MSQEEAFDKYDDLLDLKKGEVIVAGTPLTSLELHKMAYFTRNKRFLKPNKLIILPYLHERKIYLNKMKPTSQYFYTSLKPDWHKENKNLSMLGANDDDSELEEDAPECFDDNDKSLDQE